VVSPKPIVLIAEDNPDVREMTKYLLEMEGCFVIEAADGMEAIEQALVAMPHLILLDIRMPLMDGLEVARRLRQSSGTRDIPILAVTASHEKRREAIEAGCDNCVCKPLLPESIRKLLTNYIRDFKHPDQAEPGKSRSNNQETVLV